ncbi:MAG: multi-sensor signal transduction histidine kinase [Pedosphaera sp.]|nr:multi-sensor signal transduction histidine kinase [Pedosphaera sp.]
MVVLAAMAHWELDSTLGGNFPYVTFYLAVLVTTTLGGWKPGVVAMILGALATDYFFIYPHSLLTFGDTPHVVAFITYLIVAGASICLSEGQWMAQRRAEATVSELQKVLAERAQAEKWLAESEERYRSLFENNLDAILTMDRDGYFITANPSGLALTGYSLTEMQRMTLVALCPPGQVEHVFKHFRLALQGKPDTMETTIITRHGRKVDLLITGGPVIVRGETVGVFAIAKDITEQKRAEIRLAAFSKLGQSLNSVTTPLAAGRTIGDVAEELLGWDAFSLNLYSLENNRADYILNVDTFNGQKTEILPFELGPDIPPLVHRIMKTGAELIFGDGPTATLSEFTPPGENSQVSACTMFVPIRDKASTIGVLSIRSFMPRAYDQNDLTTLQTFADYCGGALQRIRAEEGLRNREEEYRAMFDLAGNGNSQVDPSTLRYLRVNPKLCEITGYAPDELLQRTFIDITHPEDRASNLDLFQRLLSGESPNCRAEKRYLRKDGTLRWVDATATLVLDLDGRPLRALCSVIDITERKRAEAALRLSEQQYRTLSEAMPVIVCSCTADGACDYVNQKWMDYTGLNLDQSLNSGWLKAMHPDDMIPVRASWQSALKHTVPFENTLRIRRADGVERWFLSKSLPLTDAEGRIVKWLGAVIDIHDRKQAEDALRESENRFAMFMQNLSGAAWMKDIQGRYLYVNAHCESVMQKTSHEILGRTDDEIWHPDSDTPGQCADSDQHVITSGRSRQTVETVHQRDGLHYLLVNKFPIFDKDGAPAFIAAISIDITKRKEAEEALAFSNRRLNLITRVTNAVVGAEPLGNQMQDLAQTVRAAYNVDACAIRIIENEELVFLAGSGIEQDHLAPRISFSSAICQEIVSRRAPLFIVDVRAQSPESALVREASGHHDFVSYAVAPLLAQDRIIGILEAYTEMEIRHFTEMDLEHLQIIANHVAVAIVNDSLYKEVNRQKSQLEEQIAERKRTQGEIQRLNSDLERRVHERTAQLQVSNRELEAFSYSVSHDLRAPLRSISGFSQAIAEDYHDKLDEEGHEFIQRVIYASKEMDKLIDDLLHLSRLTRSDMRRQPVNLSGLAQDIAGDLREADPARKVRFSITPGLVAPGDVRLVRIALENLLNNAWKFTGKCPAPRIEFGMETHDGAPAYFVRDNGAGFDMAYAVKLFGAFQRLHSSNDFPGHGIGLATVQRIINRHGGKTWATGQVDQGAAFYFTLPG